MEAMTNAAATIPQRDNKHLPTIDTFVVVHRQENPKT
jgi:hypothetical protein